MAEKQLEARATDPINPRGRVFFLIDSHAALEQSRNALHDSGVETDHMDVLEGPAGVDELKRLMSGSLWGESAEAVYQDGISAMQEGRLAVFIEVPGVEEAARIAELIIPHGAREIFHFGDLVDTRLSA